MGSRVDRKMVKVGDKSMSWSPRVINTRPPVLRSSLENKIVGLNSYYFITFYTFILLRLDEKLKYLSSMSLKPISIRWIRTDSKPY